MALLYFPRVSTCMSIAEAFAHATHDRLTRLRNGCWSGHRRLAVAWRTLLTVARGSLIVEATGVAQPSACRLGEVARVGSDTDKRVIFGVSVVLLVWTAGQVRMPVA
jgi:hypothetical protein